MIPIAIVVFPQPLWVPAIIKACFPVHLTLPETPSKSSCCGGPAYPSNLLRRLNAVQKMYPSILSSPTPFSPAHISR